jgi:hypothetical protein
MQKYTLDLESLRYAVSKKLKAKQLAARFKVSEAELADFMIKHQMYFDCAGLTAKRLNDLGVTFKQLIAEYGYDFGLLYRLFYVKNDQYYVGKTVNYLKIDGFVKEKGKTRVDCTCLACGSKVLLNRCHVLSGAIKCCGCLGTGRRSKHDLPTKNESLYENKKQIFLSLVNDGVIFDKQSKIICRILKVENDPEKIAMECNTELFYVYHTARDFGLAYKINKTQIQKNIKESKQKVRRIYNLISGGAVTIKEACKEFGLSHSNYLNYIDEIRNEK